MATSDHPTDDSHAPASFQRNYRQLLRLVGLAGVAATVTPIPRGMNLDPSGTFLYAANQNSHTVAIFRVNLANGTRIPAGVIQSPTPVDVEFGPPV